MNEKQLESRIRELTSEIEAANKERHNLETQLLDVRTSMHKKRFQHWSPVVGNYFACFAKETNGHHSTIVKLYLVTDIDEDRMFIDTIETNYHECDYDYWCKTEHYRLAFSSFEELERLYNIYVLDSCQAVIFQNKLNTLSVTYKNCKEVEETFAKVADRRIS